MVIGVVTATLSMPDAHSLKDKRSVLRSLKDRMLHRMNVSIAEVGRQDVWQMADIAVVTVAATSEIVQSRISDVSAFLRGNPRYVLVNLNTEML